MRRVHHVLAVLLASVMGAEAAIAAEATLTIGAEGSYVDQASDHLEGRYFLPADLSLRLILGDVVGDAASILIPTDALAVSSLRRDGSPEIDVWLRSTAVGTLVVGGTDAGKLEVTLPLYVRSAGHVTAYNLVFTTEATALAGRSQTESGSKVSPDGAVALVATSLLRTDKGTAAGNFYVRMEGRLSPVPVKLSELSP